MKTVLVVDDEYALVESLAELLGDEGYRVAVASNGEEALVAVEKETPDLLITDFMMPTMNGLELVTRLRGTAFGSRLPIVMISASSRRTLTPLQSLGVAAVLEKPFQWNELRALIHKLIGRGEKSR